MSKRANPTVIGAFVVGALALAVAAVLLFGGGRFFTESREGIIYFRESIAGLDVGAPVRFSGVTVGSVTNVELLYRVEERAVSIPVFIELFPESLTFDEAGAPRFDLKALVDAGMRAQLGLDNLVTSRLAINLVMAPNTRIQLEAADPETFQTHEGIIEIPIGYKSEGTLA